MKLGGITVFEKTFTREDVEAFGRISEDNGETRALEDISYDAF